MGLKISQWLPEANFGGMERFAMRLHAELAQRGHMLATWYGPGLDLDWAAHTVLGRQQTGIHSQPKSNVLKELRKNPPDILIHHTGHSLRIVPLLRLIMPNTRHIRIFNLGFGKKFDAFHRLIYALTWRCVFFTKRSRNQGFDKLPLRPNTAATVRFGVELPKQVHLPQRTADEPLRLCCLSRIDPGKGQRELLLAVAAAMKQKPELKQRLHLCLVGGHSPEDEGYIDELKGIIAEHQLETAIELRGHSDNPAQELEQAHLQVYASRDELYGFGLIEAYALGRPALCTPRGSFCELHDQSRGWFIDVDDHDAAYKTLCALAEIDVETLNDKGRSAREFAERAFDWTRSIDRFERILNS
jgi:glycosyltransferase involved in cell wall biosynthesis